MKKFSDLLRHAVRYYRLYGFKALLQKVRHEFQHVSVTFLANRRQLRPAVDVGPDAIRYSLDSLGSQTFKSTGVVPVIGWACAKAGIAAIDIYLDDTFLKQITVGRARPDVAAVFPDIAEAGRSGFSESIDLPGERSGYHTLAFAIHDCAGHTVRIERTVHLIVNEMFYHEYYLHSLPTPHEEETVIEQCVEWQKGTLFELWIVVGQEGTAGLLDAVHSVVSQAYPKWRLHLLPMDGVVVDWPREDKRIVFSSIEDLRQQSVDSSPTFLAFLSVGEILAPAALSRAAAYLRDHPDVMLLYGDHDRIKPGGLHCEPSFKPDWSPDYFLAKNYIGGFFFLRQTTETIGFCHESIQSGSPAWRYDILLRTGDAPQGIAHLPEILWSERYSKDVGSSAGEADAVRAALHRRGCRADVMETATPGIRRLRWLTEGQPKVSIIIPTTGKPSLLRSCVESLLEKTRYPNYALVFLDNGRGKYPEGIAYLRTKGLKVLERNEPFNWAKLNNDGARESEGELLLFLNDDIEVIDATWLDELVALACRKEVGSVGAMLLYPNGHIQHAGIFLVDHGGGARHYLHGMHSDEPVYENLHKVVREVSGNTGACLMIRRELFESLEGFDETLAIVGNDLDLCLRIQKIGYRNIWTPYCRLIHYESISRNEINICNDEEKMWQRWEKAFREGDPYYNPNLSQLRTDCSLNIDRIKWKKRSITSEDGRNVSGTGVNLIGYIKAEMGVGEAIRGIASACEVAGIAFDIYNYEYGNPSRMGDETWSHKITKHPRQPINILHINADLTPTAQKELPYQLFAGRYTIGYWVWELPEFPDEWIESFHCVNEVWVPSRFVQEAIAMKSPVPVIRIPHIIERKKLPYLDRRYFSLREGTFLFLMMYDIHSIQERKNPQGAIATFKQAFAPDDAQVGLVIKINSANENELSDITEQIGDYTNIQTITEILSRYEVDSLIHSCDTFVSLHRSEGFGLVMAEAMAFGKPVIATNWSGNTDFMNASNSACVDYRLIPLEQDYGPYKKGQMWADADIDHAAWWMKRIRSDKELRDRMTKRAIEDIKNLLSARRVGTIMANRLKYIRRV